MMLYHYTDESRLENILSDGVLKLGDVAEPIPKLIWLTSERFVPNICRAQDHSVSPPRFMDTTFYRFVFDSKNFPVQRWSSFRRTIKGAREQARKLEEKAKSLKDNPRKWYISRTELLVSSYEVAETDPDYNFLVEGGAINFFAP